MARVPIHVNLFEEFQGPLEEAHLVGTRCGECGYAFAGIRGRCENCGSPEMSRMKLSRRANLWSYTVLRHRPPGAYRGPDNPYVPLIVGVVEFPEGVRLLSPLAGVDLEGVKVGMELEMELVPLYQDEEGNDVISYQFKPVSS